MIWAVHQGRDGSLWIGTFGGGLNRLKDGRFDVYTSRDGLPDMSIRAIQEDAAGTLWIGTSNGGVARMSQGRFTTVTTKDGLSSNVVRSLYADDQGSVWIGTIGGGLNRLKNGRITVYKTGNGLFDDVIWLILEDGQGNLWMSSSRGIFRVSKQDLNDFADGKTASITSVAYGKADGVKSSQGVGGSQSPGWKGRDGRLWFSTFQGVSVVDPQHLMTNQVPPPVIIEQDPGGRGSACCGRTGTGGRGEVRVPLYGPELARAGKGAVQIQARRPGSRLDRRGHAARRLLHEYSARRLPLPGAGVEQRRHVERNRRSAWLLPGATFPPDVPLLRVVRRGGADARRICLCCSESGN